MAFFCEKTGVRIVAPGVSKSVDPVNGQDDFAEPSDSSAQPTGPQSAAQPKAAASASKEK